MGLRVEDFMRNRVMDNRCFMLSSNVLSTISRSSANQMPEMRAQSSGQVRQARTGGMRSQQQWYDLL